MRILAAVLLAAAALWLEAHTRPARLPDYATVRERWRASDAQLLDRNGVLLQTQRVDWTARRLAWTPLAEISPALVAAVIHAEDRRYHAHSGVDAYALLAALYGRLHGQPLRGASTLDMQLAARLDGGKSSRRRSTLQKLRQMRAAWQLDAHWSKNEVLEAYLNLVSFRGEWQGIAAASQALFGLRPAALGRSESLLLAALLPAPDANPERVAQRACSLGALDADACAQQQRDMLAVLNAPPHALQRADAAPQLAQRLLKQAGQTLRSTLDAPVQQLARDALVGQLQRLGAEQVRDGAAVVVDNASGEVLAYVGSAGPASRSGAVDGARALRQAGSTLKPFLYSLAIENRWLTAASLIDDSPLALEAGPGLYVPQNYSHAYLGMVSLRTALAGSLNMPAVRTLVLSGVDLFRERLHTLGYVAGLTQDGSYYGYSLALGSVEVSLLEQVNAYRTLANGGRWSPLRYEFKAADDAPARHVISPQAAWIVGDILADRSARAVTFDFEGPLSTPYWAAVKTGTSKNLRDNWCIGYTPRYTVGVWVGNFEGDAMRTVSGITGAAPAWREIMDGLQHGAPSAAPAPPPELVRQRVHIAASGEGSREEWFIAGTQTTRVEPAPVTAIRARLASPADGTAIALDPDIPLDRQHVLLRAEPASPTLRLSLDGHDLGSAAQPQLWTPLPGRHELALLDAAGATLDRVHFEVRAIP